MVSRENSNGSNNEISRRDFVKGAVAAVGFLLGINGCAEDESGETHKELEGSEDADAGGGNTAAEKTVVSPYGPLGPETSELLTRGETLDLRGFADNEEVMQLTGRKPQQGIVTVLLSDYRTSLGTGRYKNVTTADTVIADANGGQRTDAPAYRIAFSALNPHAPSKDTFFTLRTKKNVDDFRSLFINNDADALSAKKETSLGTFTTICDNLTTGDILTDNGLGFYCMWRQTSVASSNRDVLPDGGDYSDSKSACIFYLDPGEAKEYYIAVRYPVDWDLPEREDRSEGSLWLDAKIRLSSATTSDGSEGYL